MSSVPLAALSGSAGFQSDYRFNPAPPALAQPDDPIARAWKEGQAAGRAEARAQARAEIDAREAAREKIALRLARLDAELAETMRQRLLATVSALCESAIAPLALDREALVRRVAAASAMLARADDDKVLRLHPDDLALVVKQLPEHIEIMPDNALERGALRIETSAGGVEDGPAHWRCAITEALSRC